MDSLIHCFLSKVSMSWNPRTREIKAETSHISVHPGLHDRILYEIYRKGLVEVAYAFNFSTLEAKVRESVSLRPLWSQVSSKTARAIQINPVSRLNTRRIFYKKEKKKDTIVQEDKSSKAIDIGATWNLISRKHLFFTHPSPNEQVPLLPPPSWKVAKFIYQESGFMASIHTCWAILSAVILN